MHLCYFKSSISGQIEYSSGPGHCMFCSCMGFGGRGIADA